MTAPQFPQGWGQPAPQQAPPAQPQYAPQQYAPQQYAPPAQPQYAPAPQYQQAPPQYAPAPQGYGYPPAPPQYGPPPQAPGPVLARPDSLDDYIDQPVAGGNWWSFKQLGEARVGMVKRDLTKADIVQKTYQGVPQTRKDGSPEWNLVVPLVGPDGQDAQWEVSGKARTALKDAVIAAGGPASGTPEAGSFIHAAFTHKQENRNGSASKIIAVQYTRPNGQAPPAQSAPPQAAPQQMPQQPVQQYAPAPEQQYQQPAPQQAAPQQQYAPAPQAQPQQQYAPAPVQQQAPAPQQPAPGAPLPQALQLDPAAQAQFANLLGGAAPAPQ